jgi:predicted TIM-barrel fold metal-dependent hydrolase
MKKHFILIGTLVLTGLISLTALSTFAQKKKTETNTTAPQVASPVNYELHDAHFHLTNYVQEGIDMNKCLENMGSRVGRVALFGIPLQQMWFFGNTGNFAPTYYLASDDPLYYYSFTDAYIAMAFKSLSKENQARFDPMITGFNPADMYAADHIKRVLKTFPGVFTGVGEFSIHKEFVSSKVAGPVATLNNPALDRILDFCGETGLVVILHNDIDMPFPKGGQDNWDVEQFSALMKRHPNTSIIWAHCGLGRIVRPVTDQVGMLEKALVNPEVNHVNIDLSWTEVAKYITSSPEAIDRTAALINKFPNRFLMGTDEVAPADQKSYLKIMDMYAPLLAKLTPEAKEKLLKGNYERLFDGAKAKVRAWEKAHANDPVKIPVPTPVSGAGIQDK